MSLEIGVIGDDTKSVVVYLCITNSHFGAFYMVKDGFSNKGF